MKNLKRALSLVLATVMVIGMMVVGASAAGYADLTDKDEIVNKEAVAVVSELGLIVGYDGKFMPDGTIDRAGMAKLICLALNGGKDPILGTQDTPTYTDIKGHWAESYIEYCSALGIINGDGSGKFYPNAKLTGTAAAKMLLTALGYKSDVEGFVGDAWEINTNVKANMVKLYTNLETMNASANLSRDNAAQMVFNALNAYEVSYTNPVTVNGIVIGNSQLVVGTKTMLEARFGVTKVEGVVTANEFATLDGASDAALKAGLTRIENAEGIFADGTVKAATFAVSTPVDMLGQTVTLYIKKATNLAKSEVVGTAVASEVNTVANTGTGDLAALLKAESLTTDSYTEYFNNYADVTATKLDAKKGGSLTVIDNDRDGVVEYVIYVERTLSEVTYVKNDQMIVRGVSGYLDNEAGYEKGDVVYFVTYGGQTYITVPETVVGKMTYYNKRNTSFQYMTVNGVNYQDDELTPVTGIVNVDNNFLVSQCDNGGVDFTTTYTFFLDEYGYVDAYVAGASAPANYTMILKSGYNPGVYAEDAYGKVTVLFGDGTQKMYSLDWDACVANFKDSGETTDKAVEDLKGFLGTDYTDNSTTKPWDDSTTFASDFPANTARGALVAYSIDEDDLMTIAPVTFDMEGKLSSLSAAGQIAKNNNKLEADVPFFVAKKGTTVGTSSLTADARYGIDAETIVYYIDADTASVVTGYKNLGNIGDGVAVEFSAMMDSQGTVANILIVDQALPEADNSVYATVLASHGRDYKNNWIYTVALEDGTITTVRSNDNLNTTGFAGTNSMIYTYTTNRDGTVHFTALVSSYAEHKSSDKVTTNTAGNTTYLIDSKGNILTEAVDKADNMVYGEVQVLSAEWILVAGNMLRVTADSNVWNIFDASVNDDETMAIDFADGQYAAVVMNANKTAVKTAYVVADTPDTSAPIITNPHAIANVGATNLFGGIKFADKNFGAPAYWFSVANDATLKEAVQYATPVSIDAIKSSSVTTTATLVAGSATGWVHDLHVFSASGLPTEVVMGSTDAMTATFTPAVGDVIVLSFGNANTAAAGYAAYVVVE